MKKKLAALNPKAQIGLVALGLAALAFAGHTFVVSPQSAETAKLQTQINAEQSLIFQRKASLRAGLHLPTIQVADLFRLARAMPDREDMPGMILTLSQVARSSGITFDLIEPAAAGTPPLAGGSYQTQRIHLLFNGDFYGLSDFLYRLRSLVAVHHGKLQADGRLFNVDTVNFNVPAGSFPQISAEIYADAYVYVGGATTPTATTPTTTTPSTGPSAPAGATAAGATP